MSKLQQQNSNAAATSVLSYDSSTDDRRLTGWAARLGKRPTRSSQVHAEQAVRHPPRARVRRPPCSALRLSRPQVALGAIGAAVAVARTLLPRCPRRGDRRPAHHTSLRHEPPCQPPRHPRPPFRPPPLRRGFPAAQPGLRERQRRRLTHRPCPTLKVCQPRRPKAAVTA